jgi:DASS family divalent anion:Na+ symporter
MTAMAANLAGAQLARDFGAEIDFGVWLVASSLPGLCALLILPALVYRVYPPELRATPDAPAAAAAELERMGPPSRAEWITGITFGLMVGGRAFAGTLGLDTTAIAFLGLAVLMATGVYRVDDYKSEGEALGILIWQRVRDPAGGLPGRRRHHGGQPADLARHRHAVDSAAPRLSGKSAPVRLPLVLR